MLAENAAPFTLGKATPDALALAGGERVLEAGLADRAGRTYRFGLFRVIVRHGIEDVWVNPSACGSLAPTGFHPGSLSSFGRSRRRLAATRSGCRGIGRRRRSYHTPGGSPTEVSIMYDCNETVNLSNNVRMNFSGQLCDPSLPIFGRQSLRLDRQILRGEEISSHGHGRGLAPPSGQVRRGVAFESACDTSRVGEAVALPSGAPIRPRDTGAIGAMFRWQLADNYATWQYARSG